MNSCDPTPAHEPAFECLNAQPEPYAASPTMTFRLRVTDPEPVHGILLHCQIRIEPQRRRYGPDEARLLSDLFGEPSRWGETLKPLQLAAVSVMVPAFTGSTEIDVPVPLSYDLEVAAGKYFAALDDGEIPLLLLFSGTVFTRTPGGFAVRQVPWHCETRHRLPVAAWRELMDRYFPGTGWLMLRRDTLRALHRYKTDHAAPTWDDTITMLLNEARGLREAGK
ncbi:hypothetical protein Pth03_02740 [Planotetraspora thailandica]|uniref:Uncharacterized protein n=1 Tax=Planotetraspora thailandica TaxID=487172 RepID=A0A8J3V8B5_9ACTN|nr:DUF6084 family protein [Planotetraspora thailandica]GII51885.1 hypothetical protein Pth03_02740 [Planotetraspora thailandica]